MDAETVQRLNALNQAFYQTTAEPFDTSRQQAWPGWKRLAGYLQTPMRVLDVGCGNARFALFLAEQFGVSAIQYHGIDNSKDLLARAARVLPADTFTLEQRDIVVNPPAKDTDTGSYDLIALFGVLHHIPGAERRIQLFQTLAGWLAPGGILAVTAWRFLEFERFRRKIVAWPEGFTVEPNDYLLDWKRGASALRYCHYVDDQELTTQITASGLSELTRYRADGDTGDINLYSLLQRKSAG